ncbi:PAS domain S-box protein [Haloparvum sp. PAK95]|uniref:PAS domain S-box protein n=1 Tax=Haloparvum sp. PAK95 TaxID=3418962 RepID=UPI003D2E9FA4
MRVESEADDARSADLDVVSAGEFLRASPDPTITVARDGTVRTANPAVETVLGHAPGTLVGEPVTQLLPDRFFETAAEVASEYLETGRSPVGTRNLEVFARHAEGYEVPLSVTLVEHEQGGEPRVTLVGREITERIDRDAELTRERDRLATALDALATAPDHAAHALGDLVTDAWERVETGEEALALDVDRTVEVDGDRARALFTALLAATAPLDGAVSVDDGERAETDVRISGSAVATDLGAAPALARAMDATLDRDPTSIAVTF